MIPLHIQLFLLGLVYVIINFKHLFIHKFSILVKNQAKTKQVLLELSIGLFTNYAYESSHLRELKIT